MDMTMNEDARFWDRIARKYAERPVADMASYDRTMDRTRAYLSAEDRMLELGCGTGTTALRLADAVAHVTATDVSEEMVTIGREKAAAQGAENVSFQAAGVFDPALKRDRYDVVTGFNLLHLLPDLDTALLRIAGFVEPRGLLITKTPCIKGQGWYLKPMIVAMQLVGKAPFVNFFTVDELERAVRRAGFEILETASMPAKPPSRFIVARKR